MIQKVDVTNEKECKIAIEKTFERFGAIHFCINSAGVGGGLQTTVSKKSIIDFATFRHTVEVNLNGTVYCSAHCAFYMSKNKEEEKGVIINVASIAAFEAAKGMIGYGASKGAVASLTLPMARDLARFGI